MTLEDTNNKRKRLLFRSWHRGTREMDIIMGTFAEDHLAGFSEEELDAYDELLQTPDPDLYDWVSGRVEVPANALTPMLSKLLEHHVATSLIAHKK